MLLYDGHLLFVFFLGDLSVDESVGETLYWIIWDPASLGHLVR